MTLDANGDNKVPVSVVVDELYNLGITSGINYSKEKKIKVLVTGDDKPAQISTFKEAGLMPILQENLRKSGYIVPTPVQKNAIPAIMAGRDVMVCAQTGSGKIASFIIPIVHKLMSSKLEARSNQCLRPQVLVFAPSRELALVILNEARKIVQGTKIKLELVCHGTKTELHKKLKKGCDILVATPGRLLDYVDMCRVSFTNIQFLVFYEARMLLENYLKAKTISKCIKQQNIPDENRRQTLAFSVAFPEHIQYEARDFLKTDYLFISVAFTLGACREAEHVFFKLIDFEKMEKVAEILKASKQDTFGKTLIFVEEYTDISLLIAYLEDKGLSATGILKSMSPIEREDALCSFRNESISVLVITDEVARGLDFLGIAHVINYDLPRDVDEYYHMEDNFIHRLRFLGRMEKLGKATTFYDPALDLQSACNIVRMLEGTEINIPDWLVEEATKSSGTTSDYSDEW